MTTATARRTPDRGTRALVWAAVGSLALGLLVTLVAALTAGSSAAVGALIGALLVVLVFAFGSLTVNAVAGVMPAAALLVALLTYVLQVVAMGVVFLALDRSGRLDDGVDRAWLAGTIIGGTLVWLVVQVVLETTRRVVAYDLPESPLADADVRSPEGCDR